ncbi:TRAFAC clade GTPase domain-containing protein [Cellulosimicrobium cellulans]
MAATRRVREQNIAVFGGSGSGKTVLLSSFYGATQEQSFQAKSLYHLTADDTSQGARLHQNYLGMKKSARVPAHNRFTAWSYSFTMKLREQRDAGASRSRPFDALRLVWHDYPGEWFEQEPDTDEVLARRVDTFRTLLRSDVALILVDGQQLLDHVGEEDRYLKSLFWGLRDGLLRLKDDLLDDGERLVEFPRIWMLALSKSDLHPDLDVHGFRDLVVEKAGGDIASLHDVLSDFVKIPEVLSVGEDFLLLSSAKFEPGAIEVLDRVGVDLILPIASVLPLERFVQWATRLDIPRKFLDQIVDNADVIGEVLLGASTFRRLLRTIPKIGLFLDKVVLPTVVRAIQLGGPTIRERNAKARATGDHLTATMTQFNLDLARGIDEGILLTSLK